MPPVSQCASALSVSSERKTASPHSFGGLNVAAHSDHKDFAPLSASAASSGGGGGRYDADQFSAKLTSSPARSVNSLKVRKSSPRSGALVERSKRSGPAMNCRRSSACRD